MEHVFVVSRAVDANIFALAISNYGSREKVLRYDHKYDSWGFSEHWRDFPSAVDPPSEGGFHSLVYHALSISINM